MGNITLLDFTPPPVTGDTLLLEMVMTPTMAETNQGWLRADGNGSITVNTFPSINPRCVNDGTYPRLRQLGAGGNTLNAYAEVDITFTSEANKLGWIAGAITDMSKAYCVVTFDSTASGPYEIKSLYFDENNAGTINATTLRPRIYSKDATPSRFNFYEPSTDTLWGANVGWTLNPSTVTIQVFEEA